MPIVKLVASEGNDTIALTRELLQMLGLSSGDYARAVSCVDGVIISACEPALQIQLKIAEHVMDEDEEALRRLAQS